MCQESLDIERSYGLEGMELKISAWMTKVMICSAGLDLKHSSGECLCAACLTEVGGHIDYSRINSDIR